MRADWPAAQGADTVLRVDGGMTASDYTMQFLADILAVPVDRPAFMETTALGAAYLAGRKAGVCPDLDGFAATWRLDRRFEPQMDAQTRDAQMERLAGRRAPHVDAAVRANEFASSRHRSIANNCRYRLYAALTRTCFYCRARAIRDNRRQGRQRR